MDPKNHSYWQHSQAIRTRASLEGLVMPEATTATTDSGDSAMNLPSNRKRPPPRDMWDASRQASPPELAPDDGTGDIDLHGDSKQIWQDLAKIFGLDCVFDRRLSALGPDAVPLEERGLSAWRCADLKRHGNLRRPTHQQGLHGRPRTPRRNAPSFQPRVAVSIPLPDSVTQQDFNQAVTAMQQAVGIEKIAFDTQTKTVILRDTLAKVTAARALFQDLMRPPAQVMVELKLIEVTRNDMLTYGIEFPNIFSLNFLTNWLGNQFTLPTSIYGLLTFGGGKTLMGLGIVTPALVAQMSKATSANLLESTLRTTDGNAATMHIGEQYPVLTSQYVGPASFTAGGTAYTPAALLSIRRSRIDA